MGCCEICGSDKELIQIQSKDFGENFKAAKILCKKCMIENNIKEKNNYGGKSNINC